MEIRTSIVAALIALAAATGLSRPAEARTVVHRSLVPASVNSSAASGPWICYYQGTVRDQNGRLGHLWYCELYTDTGEYIAVEVVVPA